jgi:hypothetical protein
LREEIRTETIRGELALVALYDLGAFFAGVYSGIIKQDVKSLFFTLKSFSGSFDRAQVVQHEGDKFELAGCRRIVIQRPDL